MEVSAAFQRDACLDHQVSAVAMVCFSDIGGQIAGAWLSPYENTVKITVLAELELISKECSHFRTSCGLSGCR
ncbi:hypothetical protein TNCV_1197601 [Trichonephila clavipes]|uniref:Uncharacterized protein n=1 Tax=Trichonephila clavipes TaxID=2585209 RepID=A0A8X6S8M7_TRICX|nr:hypothetical protein TNCV_1197601 [Trichonephila clavipes]